MDEKFHMKSHWHLLLLVGGLDDFPSLSTAIIYLQEVKKNDILLRFKILFLPSCFLIHLGIIHPHIHPVCAVKTNSSEHT